MSGYALVGSALDMLHPMSPVAAWGVSDLARRWGKDGKPLNAVTTREWMRSEGFPTLTAVNASETSPGVLVAAPDEVIAWEAARRAAGLPMPGERTQGQRGPDAKPRQRRPGKPPAAE